MSGPVAAPRADPLFAWLGPLAAPRRVGHRRPSASRPPQAHHRQCDGVSDRDLWGETVNLASPLESHGLPGEIQVSDAVREAEGDNRVVVLETRFSSVDAPAVYGQLLLVLERESSRLLLARLGV